MEPMTIGLIASVVVAGLVAIGSLIASVCTYVSFKESASASSSDEQCVKVHNKVTKTDQHGNKIEKEQDVSIHNTCLEQMQRSTSLQIPVENKTASIVGSGAVNALGGIAGGVAGGLGGASAAPGPTDMIAQVTSFAGNFASGAAGLANKENCPNQENTQDTSNEQQNLLQQYDPRIVDHRVHQTSDVRYSNQQEEDDDSSDSNGELALFDRHGRRVYINVRQNGSDIEVNLFHSSRSSHQSIEQEEQESSDESLVLQLPSSSDEYNQSTSNPPQDLMKINHSTTRSQIHHDEEEEPYVAPSRRSISTRQCIATEIKQDLDKDTIIDIVGAAEQSILTEGDILDTELIGNASNVDRT